MISLVIPVKNEEESIDSVIEDAMKYNKIKEIIVVDNASTDRTVEIASRYPAVLIKHERDLGYMRSIQDGCAAASYDKILVMDGDGQYKIDRSIFEIDGDLVTGAKVDRKDSFLRILFSRIMNLITRFLFGINLRDSNCGYKLIKKDLLWIIMSLNKLEYTPLTELCLMADKYGYDIKEIPIHHYSRQYGKSKIFTNLLKSGISTFIGLLKIWYEDKKDLIFGFLVSRIRNITNSNYSRVLNHLYVGGKGHEEFPIEIDARLHMEEGSYIHPLILDKYVDVLTTNLVYKKDVLVFCDKGRGRSVMVVCGYLIKFLGMSWIQSYKFLKDRHPQAYLTREQFRSLREYEKYIRR